MISDNDDDDDDDDDDNSGCDYHNFDHSEEGDDNVLLQPPGLAKSHVKYRNQDKLG